MATEPTPEFVADTATQEIDLPRRGPVLLGTFGVETDLQALVRLRDGTLARLVAGDVLDGQKVLAIETGRIALNKNGTSIWLEAPR